MRWVAIVAVACALLGAERANAWTYIDPAQPRWDRRPVPLRMHRRGSTDLGAELSQRILGNAAASWKAVECAELEWTAARLVDSRPRLGAADGVSAIGWVEGNWTAQTGYDDSVIAYTKVRWESGIIREADMAMNGEHYRWRASPEGLGSRAVHAGTVLRHELGHWLGIGHSELVESLMAEGIESFPRGLGVDDRAALCALYPHPTGEVCGEVRCFEYETCTAGVCARSPAGPCGPCRSAGDCSASGSVCVSYPGNDLRCAAPCASDDECLSGEACESLGEARHCVRRDSTGAATCEMASTDLGAPDAGAPDGSMVTVLDGGCAAGGRPHLSGGALLLWLALWLAWMRRMRSIRKTGRLRRRGS